MFVTALFTVAKVREQPECTSWVNGLKEHVAQPWWVWLSWLGIHCLAKQDVSGLVPCQGICPGCGFGPQSGCVQEATDQCFSVTLMFLSLAHPVSNNSNNNNNNSNNNNNTIFRRLGYRWWKRLGIQFLKNTWYKYTMEQFSYEKEESPTVCSNIILALY